MCECGCYINDSIYHLPAPNGQVYLLTFSAGCDDCETPAGVIVTKAKADSQHMEFSQGRFPLRKERGFRETGVGLVYPHEVYEFVIKTLCEAYAVEDIIDAPESLGLDPDEFKEQLYSFFFESMSRGLKHVDETIARRKAKNGQSERLPSHCEGCGKHREAWEGTSLTADKRHLCGPCFVTDPQGLPAIEASERDAEPKGLTRD